MSYRFELFYEHCNSYWTIFGDSIHNDRCPECNKEIEPTAWEDYDSIEPEHE